jgi:hypothetical protein
MWMASVRRSKRRSSCTRRTGRPNEDRAADIDGAIALGPLAIACWAYDGDFPLDIESEYLPKHLLNHGWLGEFPT